MEHIKIEQSQEPVFCIYHSKDLDGICCGAIMRLKYPKAILYGYHYGDPIPDIPKGMPVVMADVSMPMDAMRAISENSNGEFTWIDHHVSAIKDFEDSGYQQIKAVLDTRYAACELTWTHFFPEHRMPSPVRMLGIYDTWRQNERMYNWDRVIMPFQYGMRSIVGLNVDAFPKSFLSQPYLSMAHFEDIIHIGDTILSYQKEQDAIACKAGAFVWTIEGLTAICLNTGVSNSQVFESVYDPEIHKIMVVFKYGNGRWHLSFYTTHDDVDVSAIAKKYGGGGHKKAAGCQISDIRQIFPNL